ncbi:MAG TPA: hypothetical protein VGF97_16915 [Rhizomicrobium sp.]|jgi:hypothetical protein
MNVRFTVAQIALIAFCGVLTATLAWLWLAPLPEYPATDIHLRSESTDGTAPAIYTPPPRETFADVDDRSVFNPERKRVMPAQTAGAVNTTSLPSDLALVGVILDGDTKIALFHTTSSPLAVSVAVGGSIEGWQIARVEPGRVVLHAGGTDQEMTLNAGKPSSNPPSVVQAIQRPQPPQQSQSDDNDP